ncbi:MarR family winged helix-turn-helix transcriptional regulator [Halodesulfovibrio marinisediminis]|uniref:MarR family transcriptional regulator, transcriptional regulator for hemolysin n=1 Tax=Halodesulfovibrio marinisediminis DSM 17456 TaxID=1121457 RepID=A0A1N6HCZ2_9BACT|nr:MarR family transcriptional regulator [Halodesulfovibrio marinisediminis]SIO17694.1 MarR family transcriptional regulator, transcriptional regulator for hemolysin [Halodesulfovibrio marinisediminis DSM 17456]
MSSPLRAKIHNAPREGGKKLGLTISEVSREWRQLIDQRLMHLGVSNARWIVLYTLDKLGEPVSQKVLAEHIGIEGPTLVRMLDRLENDGLIRRKQSKKDRRIKLVELCEKNDDLLDSMMETAIGIKQELIQDIPEEDLATCHRVLLTIREQLLTKLDKKIDLD